ncbi:MAG: tRNA (guanosine(37)-N1)-methyltransferase TrmD [Candidatus Pacebacteria bacterium]|nr:tRNA (guanosine(37)-N1)-methyltransferase TrmD [Candidatus Paceibacterota bacterium]
MNFHVVTLFPDSFASYLNESIIARAIREKKISVKFYNPRDFAPVGKRSFLRGKLPKGKNGKKFIPYIRVDDKPYGGGPGMVMEAEPILKAVAKAKGSKKKVKIILFSPSGEKFTTKKARDLAHMSGDVILICGRYEGIDARVQKILKAEEISIGDYVLTGGELPAMVLIDSVSRQIPGVLGNFNSLEESRVSSSEVYTRPEVLTHKGKKYKVPKVLLSGHHQKIDEWKARK